MIKFIDQMVENRFLYDTRLIYLCKLNNTLKCFQKIFFFFLYLHLWS